MLEKKKKNKFKLIDVDEIERLLFVIYNHICPIKKYLANCNW